MPKAGAEAKRVEMIDLASIKDVLLSVHYSDSKWTAAFAGTTKYIRLLSNE